VIPNLSLTQALEIYEELLEAYQGTNGFGGNVAEIYAYRLSPEDPSAEVAYRKMNEIKPGDLLHTALIERGMIAAYNLKILIEFFIKRHEDAKVTIEMYDDKKKTWIFAPYKKVLKTPFIHRCHVRIEQ